MSHSYTKISNNSIGQWKAAEYKDDFRMIEYMLGQQMSRIGYRTEMKTNPADFIKANYHSLAMLYKEIRPFLKGEEKGAI